MRHISIKKKKPVDKGIGRSSFVTSLVGRNIRSGHRSVQGV